MPPASIRLQLYYHIIKHSLSILIGLATLDIQSLGGRYSRVPLISTCLWAYCQRQVGSSLS